MTHGQNVNEEFAVEKRLLRYRAAGPPARLRSSVLESSLGRLTDYRGSRLVFAAAAAVLVGVLQFATDSAYRDVSHTVESSSLAERQSLVAALAADLGGDSGAYAAADWALVRAELDMGQARDRVREATP
jgi:hypothetical protein